MDEMPQTNLEAMKEAITTLGNNLGMPEEEITSMLNDIDNNSMGIIGLSYLIINSMGQGGGGSSTTLQIREIGASGYSDVNCYNIDNYYMVDEDGISGVRLNSQTTKEQGMYKVWEVPKVDNYTIEGILNCTYYYYTDDNLTKSDFKQGTVVFKEGYGYFMTDEDITNFSDKALFVKVGGVLQKVFNFG